MRIYDAADFGAAIRQRRKSLHYTQVYVAEATGLSVSFISDVERGKTHCRAGQGTLACQPAGVGLRNESAG